MTTELRDRLIMAMHERSAHESRCPARFCDICREVVDSIMPVIRDWIWNGVDNDDLD